MPNNTREDRGTRRYNSDVRRDRAARTRRGVLEAAARMFVERGYAATGVRDIAEAAGVSVKTIYDTLGSKANLFKTVVDVAVVGDDEPAAVMDREEFSALGRGDLPARVAAGVRLAAAVNRRTAELMHVWRAAADTDPDLAARLAVAVQQQRQTTTAGLALIADRPLDVEEAQGLWAMTGDQVYRVLVRDTGWTDQQYEAWLTRFLTRHLDVTSPCSGSITQREQQ